MDAAARRAHVDAGVRRVRACARRTNSEDSIEVLSTTESIFPDDLTAITEEEGEYQPLSNGFDEKDEALKECEDEGSNERRKMNGNHSENEKEESVKQTAVSGGFMKEVIRSLRKNQVYKDKMSKQGNTSATLISKARLQCKYQTSVHTDLQWVCG